MKYYTATEVVKILPYIKSYIRDIKRNYKAVDILNKRFDKLNQIATMDKDKFEKIQSLKTKIIERVQFTAERYIRWKNELREINCYVCTAKYGRIDVPIFDPMTEEFIFICVGEETTHKNLKYHEIYDQNYRNAKPFYTEDNVTN